MPGDLQAPGSDLTPAALARLRKATRLCDGAILVVGMLMIVYVGIAVFGLVSSSARHYAAFRPVRNGHVAASRRSR